MACFTYVELKLDDKALEEQARKNLKLEGVKYLTNQQAASIRKEYGVLKAIKATRRIAPTAVIKRDGDKLTITASV